LGRGTKKVQGPKQKKGKHKDTAPDPGMEYQTKRKPLGEGDPFCSRKKPERHGKKRKAQLKE